MIPNRLYEITNAHLIGASVLCRRKSINMKIKVFCSIFLLLVSLTVAAQAEILSPKNPSQDQKLALKLEYFGELVLHPGISLGLNYQLAQNSWATIHWDADLGAYWHRWNHSAAFFKSSIGARMGRGLLFADLNLGLGYMHSWAAGTLYQRAENGGVEIAANWGHSHFMPTASLLFGWQGSQKQHLPWSLYLGPEVYLQSHFNHSYLPHIAVKMGITYKIKQA